MNLRLYLSIAQDKTLSNFMVDQYIAVHVEIIKRHPMSDFTNEINCKCQFHKSLACLLMSVVYSIQRLKNLMDIFPKICNDI